MNLYRGCTHGCIYCDSRSHCYQFDHDFEDVAVKQSAPELLEQALRSKRKRCMIGTGSMSDPYQPLEEQLRLTRQCLELIDRYEFGATVITKSDLVLRDLDLFQSIHEKAKSVLQISLTIADEELSKVIEPHVCNTTRRYEVLKEFQKAGVPTVVWLTPLLPYLSDTRENLETLLHYCADAGVKGVIFFGTGMTLREGDREYYYSHLDKHFPGLVDRYQREFGNAYEVASPNWQELNPLFHEFCEKYGIIHTPEECFSYLHDLPEKYSQMSFFGD